MIIKQSKVKVIDNSGVALGQCIHVYGKKVASIGDEILIAVKRIRRVKSSFTKGVGKTTRIQKGGTYPALVVWAKKPVKAADGSFMSFDENAVVLLKKRGGDPLGSRILGSVPASCNNPKVISLSNRVIF